MDKTEKRRWTRADILLISVGLLLLLALIGQEIVAFQIERKNKAERFAEDECLRRVMEVYKCDKYEEADLDDYCSRGEKKGATE